MGRRGPAAKPTATKKREGTYRADRNAKREPQPDAGVGPMPDTVAQQPIAKACWEALAPILLKLRVMTTADWLTFAGLCRSYSVAVRADEAVDKRGVLIRSPYGRKTNPALATSRLAWAEVRKFAAEFGLSPAARTRVNAAEGDNEQDQAEKFLFGGGKVVGSIGA